MRSATGCAALGALLLIVAGTFDAEPLYVTGSALLLLAAAAAGWIGLGGRGARVTRTLSRPSVVEGEPLEARLEVRAGRLPLPPGWIDEPLLDAPVRLPAGRRRASVRVEVSFERRGRRQLAPPALVLRDPFGLAERVVPGARGDELLVLPRVYPLVASATGGEASAAQARATLNAAAETEFDGLRPHVEGAPASRIHWASLARGGDLMERKLIAEADSRPLVVLDPRGAARPEDLDAAVRAAGSLTRHFATRQGCGLLLPGDRRATALEPDLAGWPTLHVRLALVDDRIGPALAAGQNRRGVILFVSARVVDRVPRGLGRMAGGCLLVVPGELGGRRPLFEVAGCRGYPGQRGGGAHAMAAVQGAA